MLELLELEIIESASIMRMNTDGGKHVFLNVGQPDPMREMSISMGAGQESQEEDRREAASNRPKA